MASSYLEVGSQGLTELKDSLMNLSETLHELFELMNTDMRQVGEEWRDGKYEEFVSGYKPQINKCEEISKRYAEWCKRVLEPAIEECIDIETTDVVGDGSSSISGGGTGNGGSGEGTSGSSGGSKLDGFNLGGNRSLSSAEKTARFQRGTEKVKEKIILAKKASDPGFETPQNERPHLSSQQLANLLNGKQR